MCERLRASVSILLVGTLFFLGGGCDTNDPNAQADRPTVQFGTESVGVIPRDTTASVPITVENLDEGEVSVEVLYAEPASSVPREEVEGLPNPEGGNVYEVTFTPDEDTVEKSLDISKVDITQGQKQARFALQNVQGGAEIRDPRELTISIGAEPIADVKERARDQGGGEVTATMQGIVTRARGVGTRIQDESGGMFVRQTDGPFNEDVAEGAIAPGDKILVTGTIGFFSGITQIDGTDNLQAYTRLSRDNSLPDPFELTLDEMTQNPEVYESRLVRVNSVEITDKGDGEGNPTGNVGETFDPGTTYVIEDGSGGGGSLDLEENITLRIPGSGETEVDGTEIPDGEFDFQGVVTQFNVFGDPTEDVGYQLLVVEEEDIILE